MPEKQKKIFFITILVIINTVCWIIPSRVNYLVAQQRDVLLTRYSVDHFSALLFLFILSCAFLYLYLGDKNKRRDKIFGIISISIGLFIGTIVIDIAARIIKTPRYVQTNNIYHRPPGQKLAGVFKDNPITEYSYPYTPKGYPDVPYTLTIDELGFRNKKKYKNCEVLVLGDSFAEGSSVSDDQSWPSLYAKKSGKELYNLGMSGGNPSTYVETFEKFGISLSPKLVCCMIYEGNDFKGKGELVTRIKKESSIKNRIRAYIKSFYLRYTLKRILIHIFSINNRNDKVPPANENIFSWLPAMIPETGNSKYYAFELRKIIKHYDDKESFKVSKGCITAFLAIKKLSGICKKNKMDFLVVYAPEKSHAIMPLIKERIEAEKLRDYLSFKIKNLPAGEETKKKFYENIENKEDIIREYCLQNNITFISTTGVLRDAITKGIQAYFTYDQHWSPEGHEAVAELLHQRLNRSK